MERRRKMVLAGTLLMALVALSAMKRGLRPDSAAQSGGACCPLSLALDSMKCLSVTNAAIAIGNTNPPSVTNHPQ